MMISQLVSCFFVLCFIKVAQSFSVQGAIKQVNNEPIIGILSQETNIGVFKSYSNQYDSYLASSYVKFVEGAGARVVPIWIGKDDSYYENIMSKINGVIFPGGDADFNTTNGYADASEKIYKIAKKLNDDGDYFPILGICLGFEVLTYLAANRVEHRTSCMSMRQPLPLIFTADFRESEMFKDAPENVIQILKSENVTANYHEFCVTISDLKKVNLINEFRIMSLNHDLMGLEFISTIEHTKYPFYGVQFHPEKNDYEWVKGRNVPHGKSATISDQYFATFFIDKARYNFHKFNDAEEELKSLIYNYDPVYTGLKKSLFVQSYFFKDMPGINSLTTQTPESNAAIRTVNNFHQFIITIFAFFILFK